MPKQIDHSSRGHAFLSASGSDRWMNCTPSPQIEKRFKDIPSEYAQEGTLAHEFAELNLKRDLKLIGKHQYKIATTPLKKDKYYSEEMEDYVQTYVDYVIQQFDEAKRITPDARLLIEEKVDFSDIVPEGFGTTDTMIIADGTLEVIDYKHGQGVQVDAEENPQLKLYGLGALSIAELMFDIKTIRLTIVQPRKDSISSWTLPVEDLKDWAENQVKPKALLATKGEGELSAGEWCKFCKAKARCVALAAHSFEIAKEEFADPHLLTDKQLMENYEKLSQVSDWIKSVQEYVTREAIAGKKWDGYKLVEGRSNRKWKDEEKAIEILDEYYERSDFLAEPKLLGIGAIEKLLGKSNFATVMDPAVEKPKGSPTLVPASDKRQDYSFGDAATEFAE